MADLLDEQQLKEYEALVASEIRNQNERVGISIGSWRPLPNGAEAPNPASLQLQLARSPQEMVDEFSRELEDISLQCNEARDDLQSNDVFISGMTDLRKSVAIFLFK